LCSANGYYLGEIQMNKTIVLLVSIGLGLGASPVFASSSFQNTCSNIKFTYVGNMATLKATCLKRNGTANQSTLAIKGIGNNNGNLVKESMGASTFQKSCGNIQITAVDPSTVNLSAFCRTMGGSSKKTSISLDGIENNDGSLMYK